MTAAFDIEPDEPTVDEHGTRRRRVRALVGLPGTDSPAPPSLVAAPLTGCPLDDALLAIVRDLRNRPALVPVVQQLLHKDLAHGV